MKVCGFLLSLVLSTISLTAQVPEFRITMDGEDLRNLYSRDPFNDEALPAEVSFRGVTWNDASIRFKGRSTRHFPKKPFRLKFSEKAPFFGARQINLHALYVDRSCLREKLAWDLFRDMGVMAPGGEFVRVILNGIPRGLFLMVDKIDASFLRLRERKASSLYEADDVNAIADMTEQPEKLLKVAYTKASGDEDDYDDLQSLLHALNTALDEEFPNVIDSLFHMESVMGWLCGNALMMMGDSYTKNYFLYDDDSRGKQRGRWTIIPWDYDMSFGLTGDLALPYPQSLLNNGFVATFPPLSGPGNVLKDRIWAHPALRERLRQRLDSLLGIVFTEAHLFPRIDSLAALIENDAAADTFRQPSNFRENLEAVKYFITARRAYLRAAFCSPSPGEFDIATIRDLRTGLPLECVGVDGQLIATVWLTSASGLDSLTIYAHANSVPPCLDSTRAARSVHRWIQIIPYPSSARFQARIRWMYRDVATRDTEVGKKVSDEHALGCYVWNGTAAFRFTAQLNAVANVCTIDSLTEHQTGYDRYIFLALP